MAWFNLQRSIVYNKWAKYIVAASVMGVFGAGVVHFSSGKRYAVLVVAEPVTSDVEAMDASAWHDLILEYQMLLDRGYEPDTIVVHYDDRVDRDSGIPAYNALTRFGHTITQKRALIADLDETFAWLDDEMGSRDTLYVWWSGHGAHDPADPCKLTLRLSRATADPTLPEFVPDTQLKTWMDTVTNYRSRALTVTSCDSGGAIDDFAGDMKTVVRSAVACNELAWDLPTNKGCPGDAGRHSTYNFYDTAALRRRNPCELTVSIDPGADALVSLGEAHAYDALHVPLASEVVTETPTMGDPGGLAATMMP